MHGIGGTAASLIINQLEGRSVASRLHFASIVFNKTLPQVSSMPDIKIPIKTAFQDINVEHFYFTGRARFDIAETPAR
jgi:hypothetical protein